MLQKSEQREALKTLLRRVDEVRSLTSLPSIVTQNGADEAEILLATAGELVDELERSHRQLIETNVQLVSLREVANSMVSGVAGEETTRHVASYLLKAFTFREVFLCLANPDDDNLTGCWAREGSDGEVELHSVTLPLVNDIGVVNRAIWQNRTFAIRDPGTNPPFQATGQVELEEVLGSLGSYTVVPLQRSRTPGHPDETFDACPSTCPYQPSAASDHVPPPGAEPGWETGRDSRRRRCLECNRFPVLGVVGVGDVGPGPGLNSAEVTLLESVALSVAPVLENVQLYQDLRKNQRYLDHLLNSINVGLLAIGQKGRILTFNRAAEELTHHQSGYVVGETLDIVFPDEARRLIQTTLESGREFYRIETTLKPAQGPEVPISLTTSLLRDESRRVYGAIASFSDLSRIKGMEERIRQLDRLAAVGRFTSSVAHEIRNPLAGIAAGVEYISKGLGQNAEHKEHLKFIQTEISRLDRIIGELFMVTHPQKLSPRKTDVWELIERSIQSVQTVLDKRGVTVECVGDDEIQSVSLDPDQMQQVLINLIKNAAEASPEEGNIKVAVSIDVTAPDGVQALTAEKTLSIHVVDQGPGVASDHVSRLFEPFFTTKSTGTGLGLYVSHDIVKRHGGSLRVRSEPGRGAHFIVELPFESGSGGRNG